MYICPQLTLFSGPAESAAVPVIEPAKPNQDFKPPASPTSEEDFLSNCEGYEGLKKDLLVLRVFILNVLQELCVRIPPPSFSLRITFGLVTTIGAFVFDLNDLLLLLDLGHFCSTFPLTHITRFLHQEDNVNLSESVWNFVRQKYEVFNELLCCSMGRFAEDELGIC